MPDPAKPKRTLSEDQLAKLKIAREKALIVKKEMRQKTDEGKIQHYDEKIQQLKSKYPAKEEPEPKPEEVKEELPEEEPIPAPKPKSKSKGKKPVVICDESSSSSDDDPGNVIYIRRKSKKQPIPQPQPQPPPPQPPPIQREVLMNPNPFFRYNLNQHYM